ncbi:MFS transporter [Saccharothrix violaceirubra]|uniref:MFS family permease n=1 Tax=Saccharothrix violaceirubra TaxID=413306 RepID=A0A7W7T212_9PSEU|nr:MFS transporter [Saccharothrix violaceirubra]MBB4965125.1 MFS family permease [Saccharothrix violaceirubra]
MTSLWRQGNFRNLWLAQTLSLVGTQVTVLAFPLVALLLLDASALEVSLLYAIEFVPVLLLGLPAGALVERLSKRLVLLVSDAARAVALLLVPVAWVWDFLSLPLVFAVAFVVGLGTLFFDVAQGSYLPGLVDERQLADANAKIEVSRSASQLAGPTAGGVLVQFLTAPVAVLLDAVSYVVSFVLLLFVKGRDVVTPPEERQGLRQEIGEGLRFVLSHRLLRPLAWCDALANLAFAAVLALQVVYAADDLKLGATAIGVVLAVGNAGGLVGALVCGKLGERFPPGPLLLGSIALFTIGAAILPLSTGAVSFGVGLFVVYLGVVVYNVVGTTLRQLATPERLLGRMNATLRFIEWGTLPLGAAVGGLLVAPLGLRGVLWLAAGVCALSILPPLLSPVRALMENPSADEPEAVAS